MIKRIKYFYIIFTLAIAPAILYAFEGKVFSVTGAQVTITGEGAAHLKAGQKFGVYNGDVKTGEIVIQQASHTQAKAKVTSGTAAKDASVRVIVAEKKEEQVVSSKTIVQEFWLSVFERIVTLANITKDESGENSKFVPLSGNIGYLIGSAWKAVFFMEKEIDLQGCSDIEVNSHICVTVANEKIKKLFNIAIVKKIDTLPQYEGSVMIYYDISSIRTLFNKLYIRPTFILAGMSTKNIYDQLFLYYVRVRVRFVKKIISDKKFFLDVADEYDLKSHTDKNFDVDYIRRKISAKHNCAHDYYDPDSLKAGIYIRKEVAGEYCDKTWIGFLLRRQIDGTLPAVIEALNTILKDYDPEEYQRGILKL